MTKTARIEARIEPEIKKAAEKIFKKFNLTAAEAVRMFYKYVQLHKDIPLECKIPHIPNKETIKAIKNLDNRKEVTVFENYDDWKKLLEKEGLL